MPYTVPDELAEFINGKSAEIDRFVKDNPDNAYAIGRFLHLLDEKDVKQLKRRIGQLPKGTDLTNKLYAKRQRTLCCSYLKDLKTFYRLYSQVYESLGYQETRLEDINPKHARALARNRKPNKHITGTTKVDVQDFPYPPQKALDIAVNKSNSPEALAVIIDNGLDAQSTFPNEPAIAGQLDKDKKKFCDHHHLEQHYKEIAAHGGGDFVDHAWLTTDAQDNHHLVLVELKDAVHSADIYQPLTVRNELLSKRQNGKVHLYLRHPGRKGKRLQSIECRNIKTWLIGQTFADDVYYAILGQDITLFRTLDCQDITKTAIICGRDEKLDQEKWRRFSGKIDTKSFVPAVEN